MASTARTVAIHGSKFALIGKTAVGIVVAGALVTGGLKLTHTGPFRQSALKTHKTVTTKKRTGPTKKASSTKKKAVALTTSGNVALTVPVSGSGGFNYTQGTYLEGFEFNANRSISITKLGAYDSNRSALPRGTETFATVPVALYDITSHTHLGSVNVSASDPPTGVYRYALLPRPITLRTSDTYAVVWVSHTNFYIAEPTLVASDVNPAINYVAMTGLGPGGLTMTETMVEPNWFFTKSANGLTAINWDLGPNFMFTSSGTRHSG